MHLTDITPPPCAAEPISNLPDDWHVLVRCNPLLTAWSDYLTAPKVFDFLTTPTPDRIHPRYRVLPHSQAVGPDLEGLHRFGGQSCFAPEPGHMFLFVELKDLRLRALAAACLRRSLKSVLADVFTSCQDPHDYAARLLADLIPRELLTKAPTIVRALLSAVPTGLSLECVRAIARTEFGLNALSLSNVSALAKRLVDDVYPEFAAFLKDDTLEVLANNLGTTLESLQSHIRTYFSPQPPPHRLRDWFGGAKRPTPRVDECLWALLEHCSTVPTFAEHLRKRCLDRDLVCLLFGRTVTTPTGRVRGRLLFSEARRAEYLDVADDAAKAALFAVVAAGFRVAAVVKDIFVIEFPTGGNPELTAVAERVGTLAREGAQEMIAGVPVVCRTNWAERW